MAVTSPLKDQITNASTEGSILVGNRELFMMNFERELLVGLDLYRSEKETQRTLKRNLQ